MQGYSSTETGQQILLQESRKIRKIYNQKGCINNKTIIVLILMEKPDILKCTARDFLNLFQRIQNGVNSRVGDQSGKFRSQEHAHSRE